jgi:hypothetical protein
MHTYTTIQNLTTFNNQALQLYEHCAKLLTSDIRPSQLPHSMDIYISYSHLIKIKFGVPVLQITELLADLYEI